MITTLRELAHAMREGAKLTPATRSTLFYNTFNNNGKIVTHTCALGAVIIYENQDLFDGVYFNQGGVRITLYSLSAKLLLERLVDYPGRYPIYNNSPISISRSITRLNDLECWSREAIAEWIDSLADIDEREQQPCEVSQQLFSQLPIVAAEPTDLVTECTMSIR